MNVYKSFDDVGFNKDTVLTLGTFDGVHKGHRKILDKLIEYSEKENSRAMLLTIHPHPQIVLNKSNVKPLKLLTSIEERMRLFEEMGIQNVLVIPFTYQFSQTKPDEFIREYLIKKIGLKRFLIGYDHNFGKNREGNKDLLNNLSKEYNFDVERIPPLIENELKISSTKIRNAITENHIELANQMLGYYYIVGGEVVKGSQRGRQIGFPTANISIENKNKLVPVNGVYLVSSLIEGKHYFGMANIGIRPTFTDDIEPTLEVNFLNFDKDIYGQYLSISFLEYIRDEKKFSSKDELIYQIHDDQKKCEELSKKFSF